MRLIVTCIAALALPALAQKEELFGSGEVNFREETIDRRLERSKFYKAMSTPAAILENPGCVQLYSGLFLALGEVAPMLHKRDENFTLDPVLVEALNTQLSTPTFPATGFLVAMVRRVMIQKRLPDDWLALATALNKKAKIIDLAKLKMINEEITLIDSAAFTLPLLRDRYIKETVATTSAVTRDVEADFHDAYTDRAVAWSGATLVEIGVNQPKGKKGKKAQKRYRDAEAEEWIAIADWVFPDPFANELVVVNRPKPPPPVRIWVRLKPKQYTNIEKLHKGERVLVKGRFWEMTQGVTETEVREGLIFSDRDWSAGAVLGRPEDVAQCPFAINELTGVSPNQAGGFGH